MKLRHDNPRVRGFSLVEVMVTLIITSVGLLGIAKMHALALSSTGTARMRSLAAIEAASLASSMHTNRAYWAAGGLPPATITINKATINDQTLATPADCTSGPGKTVPYCDKTQLAAYDLQTWAAGLSNLLPNDVATITCSNNAGAPVTCTIQITWAENAVAMTKQEVSTSAAFQAPTYTLYVQP